MARLEDILIKPLMTEKISNETEINNRYGFLVNLKSNKNQIKEAVEKMFDVKVLNIKTAINPGKVKRAGKFVKKTSKTKKAYIQIQDGQKLDLFKGI